MDKLENSRTRTGVCSQYIKNLYDRMNKGEKNIPIRIEFRPTIFKLPAQPQTPVIMFAAGKHGHKLALALLGGEWVSACIQRVFFSLLF